MCHHLPPASAFATSLWEIHVINSLVVDKYGPDMRHAHLIFCPKGRLYGQRLNNCFFFKPGCLVQTITPCLKPYLKNLTETLSGYFKSYVHDMREWPRTQMSLGLTIISDPWLVSSCVVSWCMNVECKFLLIGLYGNGLIGSMLYKLLYVT